MSKPLSPYGRNSLEKPVRLRDAESAWSQVPFPEAAPWVAPVPAALPALGVTPMLAPRPPASTLAQATARLKQHLPNQLAMNLEDQPEPQHLQPIYQTLLQQGVQQNVWGYFQTIILMVLHDTTEEQQRLAKRLDQYLKMGEQMQTYLQTLQTIQQKLVDKIEKTPESQRALVEIEVPPLRRYAAEHMRVLDEEGSMLYKSKLPGIVPVPTAEQLVLQPDSFRAKIFGLAARQKFKNPLDGQVYVGIGANEAEQREDVVRQLKTKAVAEQNRPQMLGSNGLSLEIDELSQARLELQRKTEQEQSKLKACTDRYNEAIALFATVQKTVADTVRRILQNASA